MSQLSRRFVLPIAVLGVVAGAMGHARGAVVGYVNNPTTNSTDFATGVAGLGGTLNTDVNFSTVPLGTLPNNFYLGSDGVTLTPSDSTINQVLFGAGPGQGNTFTGPLSSGEGLHAASNYLYSLSPGSGTSSLTISFNTPVLGVGLYTIDYFGPEAGTNTLSITAFTGPNGTGTNLGTFTGVHANFQMNFLYFLGLTSSAGDIGSVVFSRSSDFTGDNLGIGTIEFASAGSVVPEPSSLVSASIAGLLGLGYAWRRRKSRLAA